MKASIVGTAKGGEGIPQRIRALMLGLGRALSLPRATLAIMLTDDEGIREMNARFRKVDHPTDVLSFPAASGDPDAPGHYLGDLVISLDTAARQAAEHGHVLVEEVEVLVLHGVLHLLGHDHETDGGKMREVEARLARQLLGSTRGLVERTEGGGEADDAD